MLRRLCVLLSLGFLLYAAALTVRSLPGYPQTRDTHTRWPWLGDKPVGEDGFYMLTIAEHMAREHRIVYNYGAPATGFQPLTTFLWAALAAANALLGGDRWMLIRLILFFSSALFAGFVWLLAWFAAGFATEERRDLVFFFAFVLTLLDFSVFRLFTYGLETGPYLVCLLLCVALWRRLVGHPRDWKTVLGLGAMAGVTGLARIDFGFVFALVLLAMLWRRYAAPVQVAVCGLLAFLIVSPWFLYVHGVTGGWLPSSGKAEGQLIRWPLVHGRLFAARVALLVHLVPWSFASASPVLRVFAEVCFVVMAILAVVQRHRLGTLISPRMREVLLPWAAGFGALVVIYPLFFWTDWFYPRYYAVLLVVWIPVLALWLAGQAPLRRFPLVVPAALLVIWGAEDVRSLHTGHIATNHLVSAGYIHDTYPTARVGAFQSGVIGFLDPNVSNLDGKMNDEALKADAGHHLDAYLDASRIGVLVDWEALIRHHLPDAYLAQKWKRCPKPMPIADSVCYVRKAP